jgi:hypothetical protein
VANLECSLARNQDNDSMKLIRIDGLRETVGIKAIAVPNERKRVVVTIGKDDQHRQTKDRVAKRKSSSIKDVMMSTNKRSYQQCSGD